MRVVKPKKKKVALVDVQIKYQRKIGERTLGFHTVVKVKLRVEWIWKRNVVKLGKSLEEKALGNSAKKILENFFIRTDARNKVANKAYIYFQLNS